MNTFWESLCAIAHRLTDRRGQGTVEYLGLVLAVGALLLAVSVQVKGGGTGIGEQISNSMEKAISSVAKS
jgi:hypothetical protein